jgi:uncharacterized protein YjbI with pentapeptide repeats
VANVQRSLSATDVLRLYAAGERDFRELDVVPEGDTFENKRLDGADFSSSFISASFAGAGLRGARFVNANVKTCIFDRADLSGATFEGAAVDAATFVRAELERATFAGATYHSHVFTSGELPPDNVPSGGSPTPGRHSRFRQALAAPKPFEALQALARELRDEGEGQSHVLGLFELFRSDHQADVDESLSDAILDTMDLVTGWCSPRLAIFKPSSD